MHDVVVVGAGATGLAATAALAGRGLSVLLLDAGPRMHGRNIARRSVDLAGQARAENRSTARWSHAHSDAFFVRDEEHPYETPEEHPFRWIRGRQVGGRLHMWGRVSLRMSDRELRSRTFSGSGIDWPIGYADLAPSYAKMERLLDVTGEREGSEAVPDGEFSAPLGRGPGEEFFRAAVATRWPDRRVLTGRIATRAAAAIVRAATSTGHVAILPNAIALRIETDAQGRATGVTIADRETLEVTRIAARIVCLCASPIESVRILLESTDQRHPNGLGNSSGLLGAYVMDHLAVSTFGIHRRAPLDDSLDAALASAAYCHVPSIMPDDPRALQRAYGVTLAVYRGLPPVVPDAFAPMVGEARRIGAIPFWMQAFGEVMPRRENRVTLTDRRDRWGARIPRIDVSYTESERALAANSLRAMHEMGNAAGFEFLYDDLAELCPGGSVHEMGGARMGTSPADSVVREDNRLWDTDNVYVLDGSSWPSGGWQNPALTMMAVAHRAAMKMAV